MSAKCQICSKKRVVGRTQRHKRGVAGKRWAKRAQKTVKIFKPNLQYKKIGGKRMRLCTKCLKKLKKEGKFEEVLQKILEKKVDPVSIAGKLINEEFGNKS